MATLRFKLGDEEHEAVLHDVTRIGREEDNEISIDHDSLSRHHAVIRRHDEEFHLADQGSRNGIVFRGQHVKVLTLEDGAKFQMGDVEFVFSANDGEEPAAGEQQEVPAAIEPESMTPPVASPPIPAAEILQPQPPPTSPDPVPVAVVEETAIPEEPNIEAVLVVATPLVPVEEAPAAPTIQRPADKPLAPHEAAVAQLSGARDKILDEMGKVIVGQKTILNQLLVALFARGHCLMIGVPGLAKTLMVKTLGQVVALDANRIQFTPDLMPSDITGTDILEEDPATGRREFRFHKGPLFTNLLLADEINRTPPKTQAALLEAMQERRVTAAGKTFDLPDPFMVLATQNPIEQEGTYPLPEAQLDRFMFCVLLKYPSLEDEQRVLLETTRDAATTIEKVIDGPAILRFQHLVRQVPVSEHVALYAMNLIRTTRPETEGAPDFIKRWVRWGAGTRAGQYLLLAAKAHVLIQGRVNVSCADIREYALPVLRHRMFCNFAAASEGVNTDDIVKKVLETVKEPDYAK